MLISPTGFMHATAIAVDGKGVLIRGKSKAGKSTLAEALIIRALAAGHDAALIGDDRIRLCRDKGVINLMPHPSIAGLIERRGTGIERIAYITNKPLALLIALEPLAKTQAPAEEISANARPFKEIVLGLPILRLKFYHQPAVDHVFPLVLAALAK